jgi:hypothetical protein
MPPKAKGDDAKMADAEKKVRDCRSPRGGRRVASLQRDCLRAVLFILSDCHALAASGRGATRARRAHSNIQKCSAHRCWPRSCVSMRQAVDAAKDKANEEMPVDPVVAAMTGEFLRPIPRVVSAQVIARPAARRACAQCSMQLSDPFWSGSCDHAHCPRAF